MELISARLSTERRGHDPKDKRRVHFLRVSPAEAQRIIRSLAAQLVTGSPNTGREEFECKNGDEFTIAVHPNIQAERAHIQRVVEQLLAPIEERWRERYKAGSPESEMLAATISTVREMGEKIKPRDYLAEEEVEAAKRKRRRSKAVK